MRRRSAYSGSSTAIEKGGPVSKTKKSGYGKGKGKGKGC